MADKKSKLHQAWLFLNLAIAIWLTGLGFTMLVKSESLALFFQKVLYIGTIFIPVYFVKFSSLLTEEKEKTKELQIRVEELERFHCLTVGRELKMVELKKEIERLKNNN